MRKAPLLAALLVACRVAPEEQYEPEVRVPSSWNAPADPGAVAETAWWTTLGPAVTAVVEEALAYNHDLAAAAARVEAAAALARIAGADELPAVGANFGRTLRQDVFIGFPAPSSRSRPWTASLDVAWELDLWGRLAAATRAAEREFEATAADYRAAQHSIAARTVKAWLTWQEARLQQALADETALNFRRNAQLIRDRYEGGRSDALDLRLAETNAASAEALAAFREEERERSSRALEILTGRYPSGEIASVIGLPDLPPPPPAGLPSELLQRRPDLRAQELRLLASDERLYAARAELYPRFALTASGGRLSEELEELSGGSATIYSLLGNVTQPIFQGGRLRAGIDLEDARTRELLASYAGGVLLAFAEVETALAVEEHLADREDRLRDASENAAAARDLAEDRYSSGLTPLITVLEAQRRALNNESEHLTAQRQRLDARVDLHLALGGGFGGESE